MIAVPSIESELLACRVREDELHKQVDASRSALLTAEIALSRTRVLPASQPMFGHLTSSIFVTISTFLEVGAAVFNSVFLSICLQVCSLVVAVAVSRAVHVELHLSQPVISYC